MSMLNLDDEALLSEMMLFPNIPNEYIAKYLDLWLKTIDDFQRMGLDVAKTNIYIRTCLKTLTASILHLLPEQFFENILRKFLFHIDIIVFAEARRITILYILTEDKENTQHALKNSLMSCITQTADSDQLEKLCVYQVNKKMHFFIKDFVASYKLCFNTINPQIIDNMQMIYSSVFSPKQDVLLAISVCKKVARMQVIFKQGILAEFWPENRSTVARINRHFLVAINFIYG